MAAVGGGAACVTITGNVSMNTSSAETKLEGLRAKAGSVSETVQGANADLDDLKDTAVPNVSRLAV